MSAEIAILLDDEQNARLQALAKLRQSTASELAAEAIDDYLRFDSEFRAAVLEGLAAVDAGDVSDFKTFETNFREFMALQLADREA
jgi:predicted transcriptional regulator